MSTLEELERALERLSLDEQEEIINWLHEFGGVRLSRYSIREPQSASAEHLPPYMTIDEFLEFDAASPLKHEYVNGVAYAMNGPTLDHITITVNLTAAFAIHLRGATCKVFNSDVMLRIRSETDEIVYHPDLTVACNKEEWGRNHICNPKLVVEVLSPSTEHIDRREKATNYRRVTSVEEYVLVEQREHRITVQRRAEGWKPQSYAGSEAVAEFRSVALTIPLKQIYADTLRTT